MKKRKGTRVSECCDGITKPLYLRNYLIMEDNWVSEEDKILCDRHGRIFNVLDHRVYEDDVLVASSITPNIHSWQRRKFSCIKLDKDIDVGEMLFVL